MQGAARLVCPRAQSDSSRWRHVTQHPQPHVPLSGTWPALRSRALRQPGVGQLHQLLRQQCESQPGKIGRNLLGQSGTCTCSDHFVPESWSCSLSRLVRVLLSVFLCSFFFPFLCASLRVWGGRGGEGGGEGGRGGGQPGAISILLYLRVTWFSCEEISLLVSR